MLEHNRDELNEVIKILNERVWDNRLSQPMIDRWLENFSGGEREQLHALHLLAHFMYFGEREVRELLQSLYRDLYRATLLETIQDDLADFDEYVIGERIKVELGTTRFLGIGNPSESGTHLLYYFRQENRLPKDLFMNTHEIFKRGAQGGWRLREAGIRHYVFLDDLCGSGSQAKEYSEDLVKEMKAQDPNVRVYYFALFGLETGLADIRRETLFDVVGAVFVLDESFRCFSEKSRYYLGHEQEDRVEARATMSRYGEVLAPGDGLGYKNCQLLVGFTHNVPDNTLPVIWSDDHNWAPIFRRYPKIYGL